MDIRTALLPAGILEYPQGKSYSTFLPPAEYARRRYVKNRCRGLSLSLSLSLSLCRGFIIYRPARLLACAATGAPRILSQAVRARITRADTPPHPVSLSLTHTHTHTLWIHLPFPRIPRNNRRLDRRDSIRCNASASRVRTNAVRLLFIRRMKFHARYMGHNYDGWTLRVIHHRNARCYRADAGSKFAGRLSR
jgi:hypothetical protein